jgi:probable O-glycosylation ligase (exosortase A-associated)
MRQAVFILAFCGLLPTVLLSPFAGVIVYEWLEYLKPDVTYYAFAVPDQLSLIVGVLTFVVWLVKDHKNLRAPTALIVFLVLWFIWINITTYFALVPVAADWQWQRTVKIIGFSMLTAQMMSNRARAEALVWLLVLAVAYSAIPGAIKTVLSGGGGHTVVGLGGSFISDRVMFAVFLSMVMPLCLYLARHSTLIRRSWWLTWGMRGLAVCCAVASVGTFARTAMFATGVAAIMMIAKSRRKLMTFAIIGMVAVAALAVAPARWYGRMDTTIHYQHNASAMGRIDAWRWSYQFALDHPIFGGGFKAAVLYRKPDGGWIEAHNIFFEVMAEHGFVGLALFCCLLLTAYWNCGATRRKARDHPELTWAADLATQIQIGIVVFVAGGQFVSIATDPFLYDWLAISIGLRGIVERELVAASKPVARSELVAEETVGFLSEWSARVK